MCEACGCPASPATASRADRFEHARAVRAGRQPAKAAEPCRRENVLRHRPGEHIGPRRRPATARSARPAAAPVAVEDANLQADPLAGRVRRVPGSRASPRRPGQSERMVRRFVTAWRRDRRAPRSWGSIIHNWVTIPSSPDAHTSLMTPVTPIAPITDRLFERLAVVGAGNMGSGIAQKMASEGFTVTLVDLDDEKVARGLSIIEKTLEDGVRAAIFTAAEVAAIRGRLRGTSRFDDLADADLVVEAVFEDLEIKKSVFQPPRRGLPARTRSSRQTRRRTPSPIWPPRRRIPSASSACTTSIIRRRTGWSKSLPGRRPIRRRIAAPGASRKRSARRRSPRATRTASSSTGSSCRG